MKRACALISCSAVPLLSVDCTSTTRLQCSNNKKPLYLATANRPSHAARPPVGPKPVAPAPNHTPPGGVDALQVSILIGTVPPPCGAPGSRRQEERTVLELIPARAMYGTVHAALSRRGGPPPPRVPRRYVTIRLQKKNLFALHQSPGPSRPCRYCAAAPHGAAHHRRR
jgi:hypothetical protein